MSKTVTTFLAMGLPVPGSGEPFVTADVNALFAKVDVEVGAARARDTAMAGRLDELEIPRMAAGNTVPRIVQPGAAGVSKTVVAFPTGRFSRPPVVTASNSRSLTVDVDVAGFITVDEVSATQMTLTHVVSGAAAQILAASWIAVQMTSTSAAG